MISTDFRDTNFSVLKQRLLTGQRMAVYRAWIAHGPATTRELAARSGINLLNVRPRTTELLQAGALVEAEEQPDGTEGRYQVRSNAEWEQWHAQSAGELKSGQQQLL